MSPPDRRNACGRCANREFTKKRLGTTGVVRSFAIVHQAAPGVPVPYVSSVVDLDGGGDVKANVVNVEPDPRHDTGAKGLEDGAVVPHLLGLAHKTWKEANRFQPPTTLDLPGTRRKMEAEFARLEAEGLG